MSARHFIKPSPADKPSKPYPEFPLFPHAAGVWAKKIRGKLHYFGPWNDPDGALEKYLAEKDALHAGRTPRPTPEALTVKDAANAFLNAKQAAVDAGELSSRSWNDYREASELVVSSFGKQRLVSDLRPDDFATLRNAMAVKWGPHRVGKIIQCVRCLFKFAFDAELLPSPIRFGPGFKRPSKKTMRLNRAKQGAKVFAAEEIRRLLDAAGVQLKAMVLLGINAGFGNSDCGNLPLSALDLKGGVIDYPRPKTGIPRRAVLWPETVAALKEVLAQRPEPKHAGDAGLVFVTKRGLSWAKETSDNPVSKEFRKLLDGLGMNGHRNFYALRHTFRTVADEAKDQPAADFIMGHESTHMATAYRETISDDRLRAVVEYVRTWLYGTDPGGEGIDDPAAPGAAQDAARAPQSGVRLPRLHLA